MKMKQSPIFSKTYDFILWLLNHTEKYPKSERFRMARRLEDTAFEFYELLIEAVRIERRRRQRLLQADLVLDKLRLYWRLAHSRRLATQGQYRHGAEQLTEIGKLLGGWIESLSQA